MYEATQRYSVHIPGTLSANATGFVPMLSKIGGTLIEVAAVSSNAGAATLMLGMGGDTPDHDAIMTAKAIGISGEPVIFRVADFNGAQADPIRTSYPRLKPQEVLTWTLDYNGSGVNEVQLVTINDATGGTFTLTYSGQTTSAIAYNATAATVQAALEALSNLGVGDVVVTGAAGGPYTLTFGGALAETNVATVTASAASLTGDDTPTITITTPTGGVAPGTAAANVDLVFTFLLGGVNSGVSGF